MLVYTINWVRDPVLDKSLSKSLFVKQKMNQIYTYLVFSLIY